MLFIYDKSAVQATIKWQIKDKDILSKKKEITYISPGGYTFVTNNGDEISFDFSDSGSSINLKKGTIISEVFSLDYDFINDTLKDNNLNHLIKDEHRLELFENFKEFTEIYCFTDVDGEECEIDLECIHFELYDPISEENLVLIGKEEDAYVK